VTVPAISELETTLSARLAELTARHGVVGASLAVAQGDSLLTAVTGVANQRTGVPVTPDTLFQIGSISKVYTATLVMQLVDEGLLDLDAPIADVLPGFTLAEPDALADVTVRRLLSHTSGVDGDVFDEFGRGDDCIERYVAAMAGLGLTSRPGAFFSYCNSGYVLLGRIIEHLRGMSWDEALRSHLLEPLGVTDTVTLPEDAILRRVAIGHPATGEGSRPQPTDRWFFSRALGPAGVVTAPARDVVAFARMHLSDGQAADGRQLLSPAAAKQMLELQVTLPEPFTLGDAWGLGWILYRVDPPLVFGHDGTTVGQQAYLRVVPDADLVVVLLTNGGAAGALFNDLARPLLRELAGADLHEAPVPPSPPAAVDTAPFLGSYERSGVRMEISRDVDGKLWLESTPTGPLASLASSEPPRELVAYDDTMLLSATPEERLGHHLVLKFLEPGPDGYGHVHLGARATPRVHR
jgi:CubicO group peptidase (beta-lactamase class C family)